MEIAAIEEADERYVFLLSDANLQQYSITPEMLAGLFNLDKRVKVYVIFIASIRDRWETNKQTKKEIIVFSSAYSFRDKYPSQIFVVLDKKELPSVLKKIFLQAALT